jgi:predicted molibdopterin-dependent oxidoreductase YjgC
MSAIPVETPRKLMDIDIDGTTVRVPEGSTILDACRAISVDTPTMCYADNLTPINACRVCVVEVERRHIARERCLAPLAGRVRGEPRAVRRRDGSDAGGGARHA